MFSSSKILWASSNGQCTQVTLEQFSSISAFPTTGSQCNIYIALDTNKLYRWAGSYIEISPTPVVTKNDVGLGNVDNTSDLNKPISTATQSELNLKLNASEVETDLVAGSGVSLSYDNTNNSLTISASVQSVAGRTGAVTLTKNDVGLGNVDNTSDLNKPISTATQTALDGKANSSHTHDDRYYTESEVNTLLSNLIVDGGTF